LGNISVKPELLNYLAERIIGILFEKARAGIPAGSATDAARTIDNDFHGYSKFCSVEILSKTDGIDDRKIKGT